MSDVETNRATCCFGGCEVKWLSPSGRLTTAFCITWFALALQGAEMQYQPTWESLDQRPVAQWWRDAKLGVYLHWTLASVPAWGTHSSFYWPNLLKSREEEATGPKPRRNVLSDEHLGLWQFHVQNYGAEFQYPDFAPLFRAELPSVSIDEAPCAYAYVLKLTAIQAGSHK